MSCARRLFLVAPVLAVLAVALPASASPMRWSTNLEAAGLEARRDNRPLLIEFWADWCLPCKVMATEVYSRDDVAEAAGRFMPVRVNFDVETSLVRKYNITAMPTILVTDSYGRELFRYSGYIGAGPFIDLLHSLPQDVGEFNRLSQILDRDRNNYAALEGMASRLKAAGLYLTSNEYYFRALQRNEAKNDPGKREAILSAMGANYIEVKDGRQAAETYEKCLKAFPNSPLAAEWMLNLGRAYIVEEKREKAREALKKVIGQFPGTPQSETATVLLATF